MSKRLMSEMQRQSFVLNLSSLACALLLITQLGLLLFVLSRGSDYFWPGDVAELQFSVDPETPQQSLFVEPLGDSAQSGKWDRLFYLSSDNTQGESLALFDRQIQSLNTAPDIAVILRDDGAKLFARFADAEAAMANLDGQRQQVAELMAKKDNLLENELADIHTQLDELARRNVDKDAPAFLRLSEAFDHAQQLLQAIDRQLGTYQLSLLRADGSTFSLPIAELEDVYFPNQMMWPQKIWQAGKAFLRFVSQPPKQASTAGGVFPAIFGTVLMVMLMTVIVTPFGVLVAVYLHEYAPQNALTSVIRIGVNNLASVPSVVFGVFGLGFFVYTLGSGIDGLLSEHTASAPKMGAPNLFWASLTMALLTLPVVIVATEEGLRRVPDVLRKGSFALGATQSETIWHTVLPIASPGIMTGIILAIARGAGEVAPLILVGAVKFAPSLPIDAEFPFFHLDRQFMHLGVMVYEGAFQSQTIGPGSNFMFASCMLLLLIVFMLNLLAISLRSRLRQQFSAG